MLLMQILQPPELTRNRDSQAPNDTTVLIALVHVAVGISRGRFSVVDGLIPPVLITDQHEAPSANTGMVHANDTHAQVRCHHSISGRAACYDGVYADLRAYRTFAGHGSLGAFGGGL